MHILVSILPALLTAVQVVRLARPWLDGNRPVGYWFSTIAVLASGPKPVRPSTAVEWSAAVTINHTPLDDDIADFHSAVRAIDPEEIAVITYLKREQFEAMLWDSRIGDEKTCEQVIAWVQRRGLTGEVVGIDYTDGPTGRRRTRVRATIAGLPMIDGRVYVLSKGWIASKHLLVSRAVEEWTFHAEMTPQAFAAQYVALEQVGDGSRG